MTTDSTILSGRAVASRTPVASIGVRIAQLSASVLQRRRNARAAAWLRGHPQYLLDDIGIARSDIAAIGRQGSAVPGRR